MIGLMRPKIKTYRLSASAAKRRVRCLTQAIDAYPLALCDELIFGVHIAEHIAGDFFDEIGIGKFRRQQRNVALKLASDGLEALDLKLQQAGAFDQLITSREAVPAMKRMIGEVGTRTQAGKQHQHLPRSNAGFQSATMG